MAYELNVEAEAQQSAWGQDVKITITVGHEGFHRLCLGATTEMVIQTLGGAAMEAIKDYRETFLQRYVAEAPVESLGARVPGLVLIYVNDCPHQVRVGPRGSELTWRRLAELAGYHEDAPLSISLRQTCGSLPIQPSDVLTELSHGMRFDVRLTGMG